MKTPVLPFTVFAGLPPLYKYKYPYVVQIFILLSFLLIYVAAQVICCIGSRIAKILFYSPIELKK